MTTPQNEPALHLQLVKTPGEREFLVRLGHEKTSTFSPHLELLPRSINRRAGGAPIRAQVQGAIIFEIIAALCGPITFKGGCVEGTNFDSYEVLRMDEASALDVHVALKLKLRAE